MATNQDGELSQAVCPVTTPNPHRHVLRPIVHHDIYRLYSDTIQQFWVPDEIDLSQDVKDWHTQLTPPMRFMLSMVFAFFAIADGIVMENVSINFMEEVQLTESRFFYAYQAANEAIHGDTYSLIIETLIKNIEERNRLFQALKNFECVKRMANWAEKYMSRKASLAQRLVAFVLYEGCGFSDKFAAIFWFKKQNLLPGVCQANLLIARDEAVHEDHGVLLHSKMRRDLQCDPHIIRQMMREFFDINAQFVEAAMPQPMLGMNKELMLEYVKFVCNRLAAKFHVEPLFPGACADHSNMIKDYMGQIGAEIKVNFFEHRNHVYKKPEDNVNLKDVVDF